MELQKLNHVLHRVLEIVSLSNLHEQNIHWKFIMWYWETDDSAVSLAEMPPVFSGWE